MAGFAPEGAGRKQGQGLCPLDPAKAMGLRTITWWVVDQAGGRLACGEASLPPALSTTLTGGGLGPQAPSCESTLRVTGPGQSPGLPSPPRAHPALATPPWAVLHVAMEDAANHDRILILDFGSQVTQLIARRLREAGVYCEIFPFSADPARIAAFCSQGDYFFRRSGQR